MHAIGTKPKLGHCSPDTEVPDPLLEVLIEISHPLVKEKKNLPPTNIKK